VRVPEYEPRHRTDRLDALGVVVERTAGVVGDGGPVGESQAHEDDDAQGAGPEKTLHRDTSFT
jgi:hypothetical protein